MYVGDHRFVQVDPNRLSIGLTLGGTVKEEEQVTVRVNVVLVRSTTYVAPGNNQSCL